MRTINAYAFCLEILLFAQGLYRGDNKRIIMKPIVREQGMGHDSSAISSMCTLYVLHPVVLCT
jgi:hypothetical protein